MHIIYMCKRQTTHGLGFFIFSKRSVDDPKSTKCFPSTSLQINVTSLGPPPKITHAYKALEISKKKEKQAKPLFLFPFSESRVLPFPFPFPCNSQKCSQYQGGSCPFLWFYSPQKMVQVQQSLIYSFVARGTVVLAEYTEFKGNFTSIASQCLQKLPASSNKFTYNCDSHTFNYLVENGFSRSPLFLPQFIYFFFLSFLCGVDSLIFLDVCLDACLLLEIFLFFFE